MVTVSFKYCLNFTRKEEIVFRQVMSSSNNKSTFSNPNELNDVASIFLNPQLYETWKEWHEQRQEEIEDEEYSDDDAEKLNKPAHTSDEREEDENKELIKKFITNGCGCNFGPSGKFCSIRYTKEYITLNRANCFELTREEHDLVILSAIRSSVRKDYLNQAGSKRERSSTAFYVGGDRVCRTFFLFLNAVGIKRYKNLVCHFQSNGLVPREHGNLHRQPHNALTVEESDRFKSFMINYASNRAILLPGRYPGHGNLEVQLLPSDETKFNVWKFYTEANKNGNLPSMQYNTFCKRWGELTPYILICKPKTDLCFTCQVNNDIIINSSNCSELEKIKQLHAQEEHLYHAENERDLYKQRCVKAKQEYTDLRTPWTFDCHKQACSYKGSMHYSFDFAQQLHYPVNPLQPGPAFFKTPCKCGLFGICCEAIPRQVNYLIDESVAVGKGANTTISLLHSFFEKHGLGETTLYIHADNCTGQNKNNAFLQYFLWRTLNSYHENIDYSFLIAGHTKFMCDACFGLIRKKTHKTFISSLYDIASCVAKSSEHSDTNCFELVGIEDGTVLIDIYDWKTYLNSYFKTFDHIKKQHHFRFDAKRPGIVDSKEFRDSSEQEVSLLKNINNVPTGMPSAITPESLSLERKLYLFKEIRDFCKDEVKDLICPKP